MEKQLSPDLIRRIIIEQSKRANVGHIGSALCVADIIAALYKDILRIKTPDDPARDRFILSKGHAALALYAALFLKGWVTEKEINSFCSDGTLFGVHPEAAVKGVELSTGSLGHGLSMGAGLALAAKMKKNKHRVFVLVSDAECDEGSLWEAVMFSSHHKLAHLIAIVDVNGQQAFGYTKDVLDLQPLEDRWRAFGWNVHKVDGHDVGDITKVVSKLNTTNGAPHVLIAKTTFGKGVSFMENKIKWHYSTMSDEEYRQALAELENQK